MYIKKKAGITLLFTLLLWGAWRIRTAVDGFADRWLSHSSKAPFLICGCKGTNYPWHYQIFCSFFSSHSPYRGHHWLERRHKCAMRHSLKPLKQWLPSVKIAYFISNHISQFSSLILKLNFSISVVGLYWWLESYDHVFLCRDRCPRVHYLYY